MDEPFKYQQSVISWKDINADIEQTLGCFKLKAKTKTIHNKYYNEDDPSAYKIWVNMASGKELHNFVDYIRAIQLREVTIEDHVKLFRLF